MPIDIMMVMAAMSVVVMMMMRLGLLVQPALDIRGLGGRNAA